MVIVTGQSGSGKSAIIQHIALKFRKRKWIVKPVNDVRELKSAYSRCDIVHFKTIFVINDPIGKEFFDEMAYDIWSENEKSLRTCLETVKILMSCRTCLLQENRIKGILNDSTNIVDISNDEYNLKDDEKKEILKMYTSHFTLSAEKCTDIVQTTAYFPLLCKIFSRKEAFQDDELRIFKAPIEVLQTQIRNFRKASKEKYCALMLLVFFNNKLCVEDILKYDHCKIKFEHALQLCQINKDTSAFKIRESLDLLQDFLVKKIGNTYEFNHEFLLEVTNFVIGTDFPEHFIRYADIGFLRKIVKIDTCTGHKDQLTIFLDDKHVVDLGKRFYTDIFGDRLLDVVLNPCLKNDNVIKSFKNEIIKHCKTDKTIIQMFLREKKENQIPSKRQQLYQTYNNLFCSKSEFAQLKKSMSPLCALIVFSHNDLSLFCMETLNELNINFAGTSVFPALCCNGSVQLFDIFPKEQVKSCLTETWNMLFPIHIVSIFHNYEILCKLINASADVNLKMKGNEVGWSPLTSAIASDNRERGTDDQNKQTSMNRYKTVDILLDNQADIHLCNSSGDSPLHIACENGHDNIVQLLLNKGAKINLCGKYLNSPLHEAFRNGCKSTVQLLLKNGADINIRDTLERSLLYVACDEGDLITVNMLLSMKVDISLGDKYGKSPFRVACTKGFDSTVQLLLDYGVNVNLCDTYGKSHLYVACLYGRDSTVELLLKNGADINICDIYNESPLHKACEKGHACTVQILLNNNANINLCSKSGKSPLHIACAYGHDNIVKLLLKNHAKINLCSELGKTPFHVACLYGYDSTVQLLLNNGAQINMCDANKESPLYTACEKGHDTTVNMLLTNEAKITLCSESGKSPLHIACEYGHDNIVKLLLNKDADINLLDKQKESPLQKACKNGHASTIELLLKNGADF